MRLIVLLLALLFIGYMVAQQIGPPSTTHTKQGLSSYEQGTAPQVPTNLQDLKQFEADMNQFMSDTAEQRAKELEQVINK